jgi:hypothetical protein
MYQIFISLRFAEASDEANALKSALEERGISTFVCAVHPGGDIAREIVIALHNCQLAIIMGSRTYGRDTGVGFSTHKELRFIQDDRKPFFLVKMCERFEEPETRMRLDNSVSYFQWLSGSPMPGDLITKISERLSLLVLESKDDKKSVMNSAPTHSLPPTRTLLPSTEQQITGSAKTNIEAEFDDPDLLAELAELEALNTVRPTEQLIIDSTQAKIDELMSTILEDYSFYEAIDEVIQRPRKERFNDEELLAELAELEALDAKPGEFKKSAVRAAKPEEVRKSTVRSPTAQAEPSSPTANSGGCCLVC